MLQQGQGYGEEELHLALVVCLLNKPSCLQMPSLVVIHPYAASALQIVVALCAGNQLPVNFMILSFVPMQTRKPVMQHCQLAGEWQIACRNRVKLSLLNQGGINLDVASI